MTSDMNDKPGRQQLSGYVMRDYSQAQSTLYRARIDRDLTLAEVAQVVGGHLQHVSRSLRGDDVMRGDRLFAIAHALGYDLALIPREDA